MPVILGPRFRRGAFTVTLMVDRYAKSAYDPPTSTKPPSFSRRRADYILLGSTPARRFGGPIPNA